MLKATGQAGASSRRLADALEAQGETMTAMQNRLTWPAVLASSVVQPCLVAMTALGAALVLDLRMSAALLLAVVAGAVRFAEPLATASTMTAVFELTDAALHRVGEVLDSKPLPVRDSHARVTRYDLSFDHVTFGYAPDSPVLRDLSFTAPERSLTALVGPSGSGKTVLVIAHRLSTVVGAGQILVLENGRVTERGTHQELLDTDGRYAAMWAAQTRARRWRVPASHPAT